MEKNIKMIVGGVVALTLLGVSAYFIFRKPTQKKDGNGGNSGGSGSTGGKTLDNLMRTCPEGWNPFGDGSACVQATSGYKCALWGNGDMPRCSNPKTCTGNSQPFGDGSACVDQTTGYRCALYGNVGMPRC